MAKIAYILLCHAAPYNLADQARTLTDQGDFVAIHFDKSGSNTDFAKLQSLLADNPNVAFTQRVKCGWGEWSLVQATLNGLRTAKASFKDATHFFLISGDCSPIKSADYIHKTLDESNCDYIEHHDFWHSGWIQTGIVGQRLEYRHYLNERKFPKLFYGLITAQEKLGLKRDTPKGLNMKIGSQWFCLRASTVSKVLKFIDSRKNVTRFFKTVWIPDECFFQTIVPHVVPTSELRNNPPTFLMFTDYGKPVTFYPDHKEFLLRQERFFARKASVNSQQFRTDLLAHYGSGIIPKTIKDDGKQIFKNLVQAGRHGRRFSDRIWDRGSTVGKGRTLYFIVGYDRDYCKHVAHHIGQVVNMAQYGFTFEEHHDQVDDLGGIQNRLDKRNRHRRAYMRTLFERIDRKRALVCVTPSSKDVIDDFHHDSCEVRILMIDSNNDIEIGYEVREKFGEDLDFTNPESRQVLRGMTLEMAELKEQIYGAGYEHISWLERGASDQNTHDAISRFLDVPQDQAQQILDNLD